MVKNPPVNAGDVRDVGSIPGLGRFPREWHGNPLQYSCLENPMGRRTWRGHPLSHKELDRTEVTALSVTSSSRRYMTYVNNPNYITQVDHGNG